LTFIVRCLGGYFFSGHNVVTLLVAAAVW